VAETSKNKLLFFAKNGKGLVIRKLTSPLFLIYMNEFDIYVKDKNFTRGVKDLPMSGNRNKALADLVFIAKI
jgi:hypothetical protein